MPSILGGGCKNGGVRYIQTKTLLTRELAPLGVEGPRLVGALVGVRAKEITLRLRQVGGQARTAVLVQVAQRGGEGGAGDARGRAEGDNAAKGCLRVWCVCVVVGVWD